MDNPPTLVRRVGKHRIAFSYSNTKDNYLEPETSYWLNWLNSVYIDTQVFRRAITSGVTDQTGSDR